MGSCSGCSDETNLLYSPQNGGQKSMSRTDPIKAKAVTESIAAFAAQVQNLASTNGLTIAQTRMALQSVIQNLENTTVPPAPIPVPAV